MMRHFESRNETYKLPTSDARVTSLLGIIAYIPKCFAYVGLLVALFKGVIRAHAWLVIALLFFGLGIRAGELCLPFFTNHLSCDCRTILDPSGID